MIGVILALAAFAVICAYLASQHVWGAFVGYGLGIAVWGLWMLARSRRDC